MKIAFIIPWFPQLSETFILNQITGLLDLGQDIQIFANTNPNEKKRHRDIEKYQLMERVHYFNKPKNKIKTLLKAIYLIANNFHKNPTIILKLLNIFKYSFFFDAIYYIIPFLNKKFDIIYCHYGTSGNIGAYLKQLGFGTKLVTMFHGFDIRRGRARGSHIYKRLFEVGDLFLSISDYNYENLVRFGVKPQNIIYHPVGIDITKFSFRNQSAFVDPPKIISILTVARFHEAKGIDYGIQAFNNLLKKNPGQKLEYIIIGGGRLEKQLKDLAKSLKINGFIHFLGSLEQEDVIKIMQKTHLFLLPSIAEALPVVLLEAQAVGLPVVATNVGSTSQAIVNEKSGFLVPERNVNAMTTKLEYLIEHHKIWTKLGEYGRKYIEERYNIKKLNQRLMKIFQNLIS